MKSDPENLQHRPFMTPIWLFGAAGCLALGVAIFAIWIWGTANSTTIVVIRHAEKEAGSQVDPQLSAAGEARAALLERMFGDPQGPGRLDAIYTSATLRSRLTAAPLAAQLRIAPVVAPADDPRGLARRVLREHSGGRVLIVGHLDTVPAIVSDLAGRSDIPGIDEHDYGVMYIVTVPRIGHANLLRLNY
ncbi:MAG: phosphoglycerate mutase family protein [Steroidobacteraceae bacterium]